MRAGPWTRRAAAAAAACSALLLGAAPSAYAWEPTPQVWNDRVFTSKAQLADWLAARGVVYEDWARRHPYPAALLEGTVAPGEPPARTDAADRAAAPALAPPPVEAGQARGSSNGVTLALGAAALVLVLLAAVPAAPGLLARRRFELAASGVALLVGVALARLMS